MASILTNTSAITALSILRSTNDALEASSERSSSGLRVNGARDNASSFSIAQGLRSDINQFGAIQDAIGFGQSSLGVAVSAAENIDGLLSSVRERVVASNAEGADRTAIQAEIDQLVGQIGTTVQSANFNGTNLLDGSLAGGLNVLTGVDPSSGAGNFLNVALASDLAVGTTAPSEIVASTSGFNGADNTTATVNLGLGNIIAGTGDGASVNSVTLTLRDGLTSADDVTFQVDVSTADGGDAIATALTAAIQDRGANFDGTTVVFDAAGNGGLGSFIFADDDASPATADTVGFVNAEFDFIGTGGGLANLSLIDVTSATGAQTALDTLLSPLEDLVRSANSTLGSAQSRLDLQSDFIDSLVENFTTGLGTLVDADLAEESVLQRNLQTQQQLGIQSLTTAAASSQSILSLFR